ncbi:MAG TPA: OmpH family outer membrane protein [Desulfurella acetivorans]|nr:OmpH family outer membrane protein [Desulfurella acetivorans]
MKKYILGLVVFFSVLTFSANAFALKVAVVDLNKALQDCQAGIDAKSMLQKIIQAKKTVIDNKQQELNALAQKIQNPSTPKKEKQQLEVEYQTEARDLERYKADATDDVVSKEREYTQNIINGLVETVKNISQKEGIDLVFEVHQGLVYWNDALDITPQVIKEYNKIYEQSKK